jgi:chromosome segregation ATPase
MTVSNDQFDTLRRLVEQLADAQFRGKEQHDREMIELRQLQSSNARAIEANSAGFAENRAAIAALGQRLDQVGQRVDQVTQQVAELSGGVDAAFRTIESMHRVTESLEIVQIEMKEQHQAQMERLGNVLELLLTRPPMPPT